MKKAALRRFFSWSQTAQAEKLDAAGAGRVSSDHELGAFGTVLVVISAPTRYW
jgi:hypothetical protein